MSVKKLQNGLYLVATPIGTARDITLRAIDILTQADVLAAEDTRNTRHLMDIHGIKLGERRIVAYHDHNGDKQRPYLLNALAQGKTVAYVSDAGTPMIADPGFDLSRAAIAADLPVFSAPGASALLAALCVAGLPTDQFFFAGFAPNKTTARQKFYASLVAVPATLVFYESPKRIVAALNDMAKTFGDTREIAVCRELTKKFEEVIRGPLSEVRQKLKERDSVKGEIVVVLGPPARVEVTQDIIDSALREALKSNRVKDAANVVAAELGMSKKAAYDRALELNIK